MRSTKFMAAAIASMVVFAAPVFSKTTSVSEIQDLPSAKIMPADPSKSFDKDHWAYKTLQNTSKKYGLLVGKPGEKFDGTKPLTRNEAAVLLVNLVGKIEQDNVKLTESEKTQIEILRNELKEETQKLVGRVAQVESSVDTLKGQVSELNDSTIQTTGGKKFKLSGGMQATYTANLSKNSSSGAPNLSLAGVDLYITGKLTDHLDVVTGLSPDRTFRSLTNGIVYDAYVKTDILKNHNIYLGQMRTPIGYEGTTSGYSLDTISRSQVARNFGNKRDVGVKVNGNYKYADYFVGVFNGNGQNTTETTNHNMDAGGWVAIKPFGDNKTHGDFKFGGGYYAGNETTLLSTTNVSHNNMGFFADYKLGKIRLTSEWAYKDGYSNPGQSADGFYFSSRYDLNDKIQLVARYDTFDPNKIVGSDRNNEYTAGLNYLIPKTSIKMQANYVHVDSHAGKGSDRISLYGQYVY